MKHYVNLSSYTNTNPLRAAKVALNLDESFSTSGVGFGPGVGVSDGLRPALGNSSGCASTSPKTDWYALQDEAARLLPGWQVSYCLKARAPKGVRAAKYSPPNNSAHYSGLILCGSVWVCPVCSRRITEKRREELTNGIRRAKEKRLVPVLVTYTMRHQKNDRLRDLNADLAEARRSFKSGRAWQGFRDRVGFVGSVRSEEVTVSLENGWHPHVHEMMLVDADKFDLSSAAAWLKARWLNQLNRRGRDATWEIGLDVRVGDEAVGDYVAKVGNWTVAHEVAKSNAKTSQSGLHWLDLLAKSRAGDEDARRLFQEYAAAMFGRQMLVWSKGLRALLGMNEAVLDEDVIGEDVPDEITVINFDESVVMQEAWSGVCRLGLRGQLLQVIVERQGNGEQVAQWLFEVLSARGWDIDQELARRAAKRAAKRADGEARLERWRAGPGRGGDG